MTFYSEVHWTKYFLSCSSKLANCQPLLLSHLGNVASPRVWICRFAPSLWCASVVAERVSPTSALNHPKRRTPNRKRENSMLRWMLPDSVPPAQGEQRGAHLSLLQQYLTFQGDTNGSFHTRLPSPSLTLPFPFRSRITVVKKKKNSSQTPLPGY